MMSSSTSTKGAAAATPLPIPGLRILCRGNFFLGSAILLLFSVGVTGLAYAAWTAVRPILYSRSAFVSVTPLASSNSDLDGYPGRTSGDAQLAVELGERSVSVESVEPIIPAGRITTRRFREELTVVVLCLLLSLVASAYVQRRASP
jgi:hypothetical protein